MLCFKHSSLGDICTNRCPERHGCKTKKIPFLIEALDILASDMESGISNGTYFTSLATYCVAPEAYINSLVFNMLNSERPKINFVPCAWCGEVVMMTRSQKDEFSIENFTKYNKYTIIYCSKECQENHLKKLAEAKSVASGTLKNHEFALIVHDADVTKRLKEKEVHLVTGNTRELRASALRKKLISIVPREKRKYMSSKEVQDFLIKDVSGKLKATSTSAATIAWRTMNKCKKMFPVEILIFEINEKDKGIEYIKR